MSIEIKLNRLDRVYRPPDVIDGTLVIDTASTVAHQGVRLTAVGTIMLQMNCKMGGLAQLSEYMRRYVYGMNDWLSFLFSNLSARQVGVFEALYTSVKPIELMHKVVDIQAAGKFPQEERRSLSPFP